jgi:hypothetical protein
MYWWNSLIRAEFIELDNDAILLMVVVSLVGNYNDPSFKRFTVQYIVEVFEPYI